MPRKKSGKKTATDFKSALERIEAFIGEVDSAGLTDQAVTWAYEAALIKTAVAFESLMLSCLVTAINNDSSTISGQTGVVFPKHLTDEVCAYLVTGGGFFDFRGRDGLIQKVKCYVPDNHWLLVVIKKSIHKDSLDRLVALRNFAAHESPRSKRAVLRVIGQKRIGGAGSWVKKQGRFASLLAGLIRFADDIGTSAPY